MIGRFNRAQPRAAAVAAGLALAFAPLCGTSANAQGAPPPPPAPRLPPIPQLPSLNPAGYGTPPAGRCGPQDWTCRIDVLERRVVDLERQLDRDADRGGRRSQSVDMTVDRDCIFDSCVVMAAKLCADAGFARGVPIEVRPNGSWQRLVRASCVD